MYRYRIDISRYIIARYNISRYIYVYIMIHILYGYKHCGMRAN